MNFSINYFENSSLTSKTIELNLLPDRCPLCRIAGDLKPVVGFGHKHKYGKGDAVQIVLQCPVNICKMYSVAYYSWKNEVYGYAIFNKLVPQSKVTKEFSESIQKLSPEFVDIYNQSLRAENGGLDKIAGTGYRKSLEFLIKDYLINKTPEKSDVIKAKFLGNAIKEDVADSNIKAVAERATWLGNDETHYTRVWDGKDLQDLKMLIDLTAHWVDSTVLTEKLISDMPGKSKPKKEAEESSQVAE